MDEFNQTVWDAAIPFQDSRDDEGHAATVRDFAIELLNSADEDVDKDVVIIAAMIHDIGWSQLSKEERFSMFQEDRDYEHKCRLKHERLGADLAREILLDLGLDENKTEKVCTIIAQHDTGEGFISKEDAIVKDADKLWRVSLVGLLADKRRSRKTMKECIDSVEKDMEDSGFLRTDAGREMALNEIKLRRRGD